MQAVEPTTKSKDSIKVRELPKDHSQRKTKGYRWMVESRLAGKRTRKFFRHNESTDRDIYISDLEGRADSLAKKDRAILSDDSLLEEASRAKKTLAPYGKSILDAVSFYTAYLESEAHRDATPVKVVITRFLDEKEREGVSERHYGDLKSRLKRFSADFGEQAMAMIDRNQINDWILSLEVAPQTKINYRRVLSNLFSYSVRIGIITDNPVRDTAKVKVRRKKTEILTPEEVATLISHCSEELLPAVILMVFCGIRNGEVFRLDWRDIDWEDSTIEITAEKAKREGHARHVTIPENALAWLTPIMKRRGKLAPFKNMDAFSKALQTMRANAGWKAGEYPSNALRKTFISCHYESFGSIDETAKQAGTSVAIIHRHYRKLIKGKQADKLWIISPLNESEVIQIKKA